MKLPAGFVGDIVMTYDGTEYTPWGTNRTFTNVYGLCAVSDPDFANLSPFTNYSSYVYGAELTGTDFDPTKLTVRLKRTNVTSHTE